jgi:hypothetical protein
MSTAPAVTEKRRDARREMNLAGSMVDEGRRYHLTMDNVSAGGTCVVVSHAPKVGSDTLLLLLLEVKGHSHHVALHVRVVYVASTNVEDQFKVGLEWVRAECRDRPDALQHFARTVVPGARGVLRGVGKAGSSRYVFFFHRKLDPSCPSGEATEENQDTKLSPSPAPKRARSGRKAPRSKVRVKPGLPQSPSADVRPAVRSLSSEDDPTQVTPALDTAEEAAATAVEVVVAPPVAAPAVSAVGAASVEFAVASTQSPQTIIGTQAMNSVDIAAVAPSNAPAAAPSHGTPAAAAIPVQQSSDRRRRVDRTVVLRRILVRQGNVDQAAYITDISAQGAFIQTDSALPEIGAVVVIKMGRGSRGIALNATVMHRLNPDQSGLAGSGFGVLFLFDANPYRASEQHQVIQKMM